MQQNMKTTKKITNLTIQKRKGTIRRNRIKRYI